jgi:putative molybdopterin biosynthesis protein
VAASERLRLTDLVLIQWAWREQGLIVGRGNPLGIHELADLVRKKPRLVLRQQGAGAQRLLEQLLNEAGLSLSDVNAVPAVALTESDVAGMVADGQADCGLAVGTVAHRFGLGFVPLRRERFDIACCRRSYFEPPLQRLFGFARLAAFRARAEALRHYDVTCAGQVEFSA